MVAGSIFRIEIPSDRMCSLSSMQALSHTLSDSIYTTAVAVARYAVFTLTMMGRCRTMENQRLGLQMRSGSQRTPRERNCRSFAAFAVFVAGYGEMALWHFTDSPRGNQWPNE